MTRRKSKNFIPHAENRRSCDYGGVPVASLGTGDCGRLKVSECIKNIHIYTYNASKYVCSTYHTYINLSLPPSLTTYLLSSSLPASSAACRTRRERGKGTSGETEEEGSNSACIIVPRAREKEKVAPAGHDIIGP